jgi:hypothetical protein
MKKILLSFNLFFCATVFSQTLTQSFNEPKVGDVQSLVRLDTTGYLTAVPVATTGANTHWDFSKMKTASNNITSTFVATAAVPSASAYTGCNMVQDNNGSYTFLKSVTTPTTRTEVLGITLPIASINFTNSAIAAVYPISLGSSSTDNAAGTAVITGSTFPASGKMTFTADGTGTLTLADGLVYSNVIRVKTVLSFSITTPLFPITIGSVQQTNYDYYDTSEKFPVLSISYQSISYLGGSPTVSATYAGNAKSFTGVKENVQLESSVSVFPNPATNYVSVSTTAVNGFEISVYNCLGALISKQTATGTQTTLDTFTWPAGIYDIILSNGNEKMSKKVVIAGER